MGEYSYASSQESGALIKNGDDLSAVLRVHIHIEALLDRLILARVGDAIVLLDELTFSKKIRIAKKLELIDTQTRNSLEKFNAL